MKKAVLVVLALHGVACDSLWDAYLSKPQPPCDPGVTSCVASDLAMPDAASVSVDLAIGGSTCSSNTDCASATTWCNTTTMTCEPLPTLRSVYLPDANTAWVVGDNGLVLKLLDASTPSPQRWTVMGRLTSAQLNSVHGLSANDIWMVGTNSTILFFDGSVGSVVQAPEPGLDLRAVYSVVANSTIRRRIVATSGSRWFVNGTGTQWQKDMTQLGSPVLYGLTIPVVAGAFKTWTLGLAGALLTEDAQGWAAENSMTTADLFGAYTDNNAIWAVGRQGIIRRIQFFGSWVTQPSGTTQNLGSVHGIGGSNVWAVGDANTVLRYNGSAWSANNCTFRGTNYWGVYAASSTSVWVVGEQGTVCYWDGTRWNDRSLRP